MGWTVIVVGVLTLMVSLAIDPKKWWWKTEAWKHRTPEAAEPSDPAFRARRGLGVAVGVGAILFGVALNTVTWESSPGRGKGREAVARVAQLLGPTTFGTATQSSDARPPMPHFHADLLLSVAAYADQVGRTDYRGAQLKVIADRADGATHWFTISAAGGGPFCLRIDETGAGEPQIMNSIKGVPAAVAGYQVPIRSTVADGQCKATA